MLMRKVIMLGVACAALLSLASCACPRCAGRGNEIATEQGIHPYTGREYHPDEIIPCLKCGGKGVSHGGDARAAQFSSTRTNGTGMIRSGVIIHR